jgi:ER-bound oxygenase mpaB/B'/Rubber oxygenase, catalytic domain
MTADLPSLQQAAHTGDALADRTVSIIMADLPVAQAMHRVAQANRIMAGWTTNGQLGVLTTETGDLDPDVVQAMQQYAQTAGHLPAWADPDQLAAAEDMFMAYGPLSCTLLFCASLPACYQMPQLAQVLHLSGQLEQHTEHRIRQTAAMIFPVMLRGGLTSTEGSGIAQILKVRLIHATIRHLILHTHADQAETLDDPRLRAWASQPWSQEDLGVPCSQMELSYTLLTFHYVFLKGMRTLGIGLDERLERAYLHTWNVVGHVLGIERRWMAEDMPSAAELMHRLETLYVLELGPGDPRPALGAALVGAMRRSIGLPVVRALPVPLIERLIGKADARRIGVGDQVGRASRIVLGAVLALTHIVDGVGRLFSPHFSITRMLTRVIGYHMLTHFLLTQTRPLALPPQLLNQMHVAVSQWHQDAQAPGWINRLEDRLTTNGSWVPLATAQKP